MNMSTKSQGPWIYRLAIRMSTIILAVLLFWVLGFMVEDIRSIPGPDFKLIEQEYLDSDLVQRYLKLDKQIADLNRDINNQKEKQRVLGDSSHNLQQTITQLLELQKLGLEKNIASSATEQSNFISSLNLFLDNQRKYQDLGQALSTMLEQQQALVQEREQVQQELERQRKPARQEYHSQDKKHKLRLAFYQLAMLIPLLVLALILIFKNRSSIYAPIFWALGGATLVKVALVMHEYFPSKYFKYILIGGLLIAVTRLLIYFIQSTVFPKKDRLFKQYREAYERFLCPVCDYPIRIGPRRYLYWTRRTINKIIVPGTECAQQEESYTCPSCGSNLFAECSVCHNIRHTMLPSCRHCGALKDISAVNSESIAGLS